MNMRIYTARHSAALKWMHFMTKLYMRVLAYYANSQLFKKLCNAYIRYNTWLPVVLMTSYQRNSGLALFFKNSMKFLYGYWLPTCLSNILVLINKSMD